MSNEKLPELSIESLRSQSQGGGTFTFSSSGISMGMKYGIFHGIAK